MLWIAGASQALAVVVVILAFILDWLALLLAAIFAAVALLCSPTAKPASASLRAADAPPGAVSSMLRDTGA